MASGLTTSGGDAAGGKMSKSAEARSKLIEQRLRSTRGQVKWTELITALLMYVAGSLAYLFAFVLIDHWFFSGGVGFWGRMLFLLIFFVGSGVFLFLAVGPLLMRRINPLYAARTIERGQPALKNSLVNFLMLRTRPQDVHPAVFKAIQRRAARDLQDINPETVIDRSHLIKAGYVLMTVVAVCCMYTLFSPKSPFRSAGRMFVPWADVDAPTRVAFADVIPGSRRAFHDEFIDVSVLVQGIDQEEPVTLYYSTADGQSVDMPLAMTRPEDGFRHQATLPPGTAGIQQDIEYYIAAGDARTRTYSIDVESAPAIIVDRVDYDYPDYTGLANRGQQDQGDIRALEGTRITISARANQPITEAFIDFDCNGSRDLNMSVDGKLASVSFPLRMNADRSAGEFESYEIRFINEQKQENPRPARHRIEVTADRAPEIEITQPGVDEIEVPLNAAVDLELKARDPDFKLSNVTIHARRQGDVLLRQEMLEGDHEGEFSGTYRLAPAELGLKAGDEIDYWADARDNKRSTANRTQTIEYRLRVVDRTEQPRPEETQEEEGGRDGEQQARGEQPGGEQRDEQAPMPQPENQPADEDAAESADEEASRQEQAEESKPQERIDPDAQPGEAFEEILKHMEEQEKQQDPTEGQDQERSSAEGQQEEGQQQDDGQGEQSQDSGGQGQGEGEQSASEPSSEKSPAGGQEGDAGDQQAGGAEQSEEGGQQGKSNSGSRQQSGGSDQPSTPGGQQESSDPSGGANKQQSPGGDQSKPGGEGGKKSNDPNGSPQGSQSPDGQEGSDQGEQSPAAKDGKPSGDPSGSPQDSQSPGGQQGSDQGQPSPAAKDGSPQGDQPGSSGEDGDRNDSGRADQETSGEGGQTGGQGNEGSKDPSQESEKQGDPQGGDPEQANGTGGAGEKSEDDAGTGSKKGNQKPKDKSQQTAPSDQEAAKDGSSPESESGRESNSQGDNSGDKSGGGEQGAGQSSDSEGTGSSGSNSAAEEGAGQSEGEGSGPTSDKPGDKQASKSGSNSQGEKAGGQGQSGEGGQASEGQPQDGSGTAGSDQPMNGQQPPAAQNQPQPGNSQQGGTPGGGGNPGASQGDAPGQSGGQESGGNNQGSSPDESEPTADDANLDYAQKATDLALEHLRDQLQEGEPDQELLDRLQWTREDMERFVKYWEQLKRDAGQQGGGDEAAEDDLRQALQGLGLRRKSTQIDSGQSANDQIRQLRESRRTSPPPEYAEQFRHFTEGTSQQGAYSNGSND